jgi:hypothetical protein
MPTREVTLDAASFLDSAPSASTGVPRSEQQAIVERFLSCCYEDLGKAPRFLDGSDMHQVLGHLMPGRFAKKDPLAAAVPGVLRAYLEHLEQTAVVHEMFEIRRAFDGTLGEFESAVRTGHVHHHGPAPKPFVHKADKVGRNDPCPCGSGKKFKQCCAKIGR